MQSARQPQAITSLHVYPGANGSFTFFEDDAKTYAYEEGSGPVTKLMWDDAAHQLTHEGASLSNELDKATVVVIGR